MLVYLSISDFAIIKHLEIEFHPGLNILSGETGAGKSIIISAMNLLLGARASADLIRKDAKEARVEGLFRLPMEHGLANLLQEMDIPFEGELLIKRTVSRSGRNRITVNGSMVTLAALTRFGPRLISISGQHAHQILLRPENHLYLLDDFADLSQEREQLAAMVRRYRELKEKILRIKAEIAKAEERQELARFQAQEIERAGIRPGEDKELEAERTRLRHAEELFRMVHESYGLLYEAEDALVSRLSQCLKELEKGSRIDDRLNKVTGMLREARVYIEDSAYMLRDFQETIEQDPHRLEQVEERIHLLNELKRKYGPTLEDVMAFKDGLTDTIEGLDKKRQELAEHETSLKALENQISAMAAQLSEERKEASRRLEKAVEEELKELHMGGTLFRVHFSDPLQDKGGGAVVPAEMIREEGFDEIQLMIAPNVGEPLMPLAKIASGGELSRIILALKSILAGRGSIETVIFDEVDSGISGATAEVVGEKLLSLAGTHQILCITHLPQLASKGHSHFLVEKEVVSGRTQTRIRELDKQGRIKEIARLLGGKRITERAISRAEEMLG
ncbi:MAG: DNA repair protein RecN [Deltaproteobacteria bacterium]|nr:MAG: DNA repair protein RecN [Deltaproteobacteria bacterium]